MAKLQQYDKEEVEINPVVTLLTGVVFAFIGVLLGAIHLIATPVEAATANTKPEDIIPGQVYYSKGSTANVGSWQIKLDQFMSGKANVSLMEEELNVWARRDLKVKPSENKGFIDAPLSNANFRVVDGELQYSCRYSMRKPKELQIIYQAKGNFVQGENGPVFNPTTSYINSCPIPPVANLPTLVFVKLTEPFSAIESYKELSTAWRSLSSASVDEDTLNLIP